MTKRHADIAFIVPLQEEFERLQQYFPKLYEGVDGTIFHAELETGVPGVTAVAYLQDDMGKAAATRAADALLEAYDVGVIFIVGIAGGLSSDVAVGDVCFSGTIIDVLENAKVSDGKGGNTQTDFNSKFLVTDPHLTFALRYSQLGSDVVGRFEHWQLEQSYEASDIVPGEFIGRGDKNETIGLPRIHDGSIVCGQVSKSEIYKSSLRSIDRKVLALETESGGVFHSAQMAGVSAVAVRGICDYADKNKNKLELQTSGAMRKIAANNAISFVAMQLHNPQFIKYLARARSKNGDGETIPLELEDPDDFIVKAMAGVETSIHDQLTILSPGYRAADKDYRLPLPRVRAKASNVSVSPVIEKRGPISVLEAVATDPVITVGIPRSYPDNSLPWVIAAELALIEIDGKQAVPIVIDSDRIKPPNSDLSAQTPLDLSVLNRCSKARPVFILTDLPPNSRSRIDALKKEIHKYPEARVVIVNKSDHNVAEESELVLTLGSVNYEICDVAFVDVARFFKVSLKMEDQEAGVLALKLQDMFNRFDLAAHPSYFAGVGGDLIYSLLKANRRSELIQLAVGGYLSFVVATDPDQTILSRTTREAFLRRLAFEQKVMRRSFSKAELVAFADEFADENDYDIDSISFVGSFVEKGLIHYSDGVANISLPFIEAYLLASELASNEVSAVEYFDPADDMFDFSTFDIYAELGPHLRVVENITAAIREVIDQYALAASKTHILLSDEIRPRIVEKQARLHDLQEKLQKAFDDVANSRPNSAEKQKLLDIATRVQDNARAAQEDLKRKNRGTEDSELSKLKNPLRVWAVATMLLGSGSESLKKAPKRELANLIVSSTSLLIDALLRAFPRVGFEQFKSGLQSDETLREVFQIPDTEEIESSLRDFVGAIVDAYEFALLGYPLRVMLEELGNAAGQKVLEPSIGSVASRDVMENLIAKIWASEISAAKSKDGLLRAISDLPPSPFLRFSLSTHFMTRVFWNHWEKANRLALLDAAEASLKPLTNRVIDKGRFQRMIAAKPDEEA